MRVLKPISGISQRRQPFFLARTQNKRRESKEGTSSCAATFPHYAVGVAAEGCGLNRCTAASDLTRIAVSRHNASKADLPAVAFKARWSAFAQGYGGRSRLRFSLRFKRRRERVRGIEPPCAAWEAAVLPLNYTRGRKKCIVIGD